MASHVYHRVSTDAQIFEQQQQCVQDYLYRMGIDPSSIASTVVEKISGAVKFEERKLQDLISQCKPGDIIYVSELSRLGRNMANLFKLINLCCESDITIIQCKDGMQIENKSIGGKALLFALSLAAEIELANIKQRTQMGLDYIKEKLKRGETHISRRSGRVVTHLGNQKGCSMAAAQEESKKLATAKALKRREDSPAYEWVKRKLAIGWPREQIISEFNLQHELNPTVFCNFQGGPLTKGILSKWAFEIRRNFLIDIEKHGTGQKESKGNTRRGRSVNDEH